MYYLICYNYTIVANSNNHFNVEKTNHVLLANNVEGMSLIPEMMHNNSYP
jgi:hypothetical protein